MLRKTKINLPPIHDIATPTRFDDTILFITLRPTKALLPPWKTRSQTEVLDESDKAGHWVRMKRRSVTSPGFWRETSARPW